MQLLTLNLRPGRKVTVRHRSVPPGAGTVRTVVAAVLGPLIAGYAAVAAVLGLVTAIVSVATFTVPGVLRAAGAGWLAAYQVPIMISGRPLGVLPLTATFAVCVLVARSSAHAARRLGYHKPGQAVNLVAPMAAVHALLGLTIAVLSSGGVVTTETLAAFLVPGLIAGLSATVGLARCCGLGGASWERLDPVAVQGLRAGTLGMAGLLAMGVLVVTLSLVLSVPTAGRLFGASASGFGSGTGMLLLSLGYFPNAAICALSFAAGPGFSLGSVSVGPFSVATGVVPGVPLLAGIPEHRASWWTVLMLLPAAVGALVGWAIRDSDARLLTRLRIVAIAGAVVAFGWVPLGSLAGGRLGAGPFDPVAVPVGLLSLATFCWIAVPGGLVAWLAGPQLVAVYDDATDTADTPNTADADSVPDDTENEAMSDVEDVTEGDAEGGAEETDQRLEPAEPEEQPSSPEEVAEESEEPEAGQSPPNAQETDESS